MIDEPTRHASPPSSLGWEQAWGAWVRDRAVLFGRAYVQCPIPAVRRVLAERLYELETGCLDAGEPHADRYLAAARERGVEPARLHGVVLLAGPASYRAWLDEATSTMGWAVATAVVLGWLDDHDDRTVPLLVEHVPSDERAAVLSALRTCRERWAAMRDALAGDAP